MNTLRRMINQAKFLHAWWVLRNRFWAKNLARQLVAPHDAVLEGGGDVVVLTKLNLRLEKTGPLHILAGYGPAVELVERAGAKFSVNAAKTLLCDVKGVQVEVHSAEDLYILREVFVLNNYGLQLPAPAVVWDIGMNVGYSVLYLASHLDAQVVGYEPFAETYRLAVRNITLNPQLAARIEAHHAAISDATGGMTVAFSATFRCENGLLGMVRKRDDAATRQENIQLVDACEALQDILRKYPDRKVVLKMDCEGSEYAICRRLAAQNMLRHLHVVMMEWHLPNDKDRPEELMQLLLAGGLTPFLLFFPYHVTGMIYAVRAG